MTNLGGLALPELDLGRPLACSQEVLKVSVRVCGFGVLGFRVVGFRTYGIIGWMNLGFIGF